LQRLQVFDAFDVHFPHRQHLLASWDGSVFKRIELSRPCSRRRFLAATLHSGLSRQKKGVGPRLSLNLVSPQWKQVKVCRSIIAWCFSSTRASRQESQNWLLLVVGVNGSWQRLQGRGLYGMGLLSGKQIFRVNAKGIGYLFQSGKSLALPPSQNFIHPRFLDPHFERQGCFVKPLLLHQLLYFIEVDFHSSRYYLKIKGLSSYISLRFFLTFKNGWFRMYQNQEAIMDDEGHEWEENKRLRAVLDRIAAWNLHAKPGHVDYKSRADVVAMALLALAPNRRKA